MYVRKQCRCVTKHIPTPNTLYKEEIGGETVWLCPTTHSNFILLLTLAASEGRMPEGSVTKHYSAYVRGLVEQML